MTSDFDRFVFIALPGRSEYVVAGHFRVSAGAQLGEFVYGQSYLSRPDAVELDPVHLRLTGRVRRGSVNGVFGAIRDTMPTSWGRVIEGVATPDRYQVRIVNDHAGAIALAPGLEPPAPRLRFHAIGDLVRLKAALDAPLAEQDAPLENALLAQGRGPLAETTVKVIVEDDHTLWLAELPKDDMKWNQPRVLYAMMQLARDCGLHAVTSRIESVDGMDILMVQRYDREWVGDGYACSRVVNGLTLLGTDDPSTAKHGWSYLTLADEIRRASSRPREDLHELFGRMCFNAAISNVTDDPRYVVLAAKGTGWRLAPGYFSAPTPLADGRHGDLAMACGPYGRTPSRENIVAGAGRFLLDRATAEATFDRISETVRSSWQAVMRDNGVSVRDCDLVGRSIRR